MQTYGPEEPQSPYHGNQIQVSEDTVSPPITHPYRERTIISTEDKFFGSHELATHKSKMIRETYLLLSVAVSAAMLGGWISGGRGEASLPFVKFFLSGGGLLTSLFFIWVIPHIALLVARTMPRLAVLALAVDGFLSGMVLGPLVYLGMLSSHLGDAEDCVNLVHAALVITAAVFGAITFYVFSSPKYFKAPQGLLWGCFAAITVGIFANYFLIHSGVINTLLTIGIGCFGAATLVYSTSDIIHDPEYDNPAYGALCLFASLFNIFQSVLYLLISGKRD